MSLLEDMAKDAKERKIDWEDIKKLTELVSEQLQLEESVLKAEEHLYKLNQDLRQIRERELPDAMMQCGMQKFTLDNGMGIEVKKTYVAGITAENSAACYDWMEENGFGDLIKTELKVALGKGVDPEIKEKLLTTLEEMKFSATERTSVHDQTMKAFIKEQVTSGNDFPMDLFKVSILNKAKISKKG